MITLEGPKGIVEKSSKKNLARGRAGFWEHLVPQTLPYQLDVTIRHDASSLAESFQTFLVLWLVKWWKCALFGYSRFDIDMRNAACINVGHIVFCSGGSLKNRKPLSNTNMCVINRRNWKCSSNLKPLSQNLIAFCVRLRKENIKSRISHFVCQRQNFDSWKLKHDSRILTFTSANNYQE